MARVPLLALLCLAPLWADPRIERLRARLGEEAAAFEQLAPQVLGTETLTQRAARPQRCFRLRIGKAAGSSQPDWQQRVVVSEYAFSVVGQPAAHNLGAAGYVFVRADNYQPVLFTLDVLETIDGVELQQHVEIRYQGSAYGAALPAEVRHRDLRGGQLVTENTFRYSNFRRFGAASEITFEMAPDR